MSNRRRITCSPSQSRDVSQAKRKEKQNSDKLEENSFVKNIRKAVTEKRDNSKRKYKKSKYTKITTSRCVSRGKERGLLMICEENDSQMICEENEYQSMTLLDTNVKKRETNRQTDKETEREIDRQRE